MGKVGLLNYYKRFISLYINLLNFCDPVSHGNVSLKGDLKLPMNAEKLYSKNASSFLCVIRNGNSLSLLLLMSKQRLLAYVLLCHPLLNSASNGNDVWFKSVVFVYIESLMNITGREMSIRKFLGCVCRLHR